MDRKDKSEACEILRKEFKKSEKYFNWRSGDEKDDQANLLFKKSVDARKLVLLIKERSEDTEIHSSVSRQQSLTDSENSVTGSQYSPPLSSGFEKKTTYWSIQRGKF